MAPYPIFIPYYHGGGGAPLKITDFAVLFGMCGGIILYFNIKYKPHANLKIKYRKNCNNTIDVYVKKSNFPSMMKTNTINNECLVNKGYHINSPIYSYLNGDIYKHHLYSIKRNDDKPISKEEFLADCKECNVKTEIKYKYDTFALNFEKKVKKEIEWFSAFKDRLE
jgi:hypothetical protein